LYRDLSFANFSWILGFSDPSNDHVWALRWQRKHRLMFGTRSVFAQLRHFEIPNYPGASRQREILVFSVHFWMHEVSK
jgi:hypothetical protein